MSRCVPHELDKPSLSHPSSRCYVELNRGTSSYIRVNRVMGWLNTTLTRYTLPSLLLHPTTPSWLSSHPPTTLSFVDGQVSMFLSQLELPPRDVMMQELVSIPI
ncbi:hypothetical protein QCA50_017788 [Cerrena zonata]|uniref:Uncharacterized protein n=1 Tax=Cerrena zonata TaxID=2478898 RepID=A0AAW0FR55_9APHY